MAEETLRLGVDPRPAQKGMREYKRALDEGASASKRLADTVESSARRETSIYQRAARERMQLERQLASRRTQTARVSAVAAAEAFVRGQEQFYQANIARIKLAQARGMMSPSEARAAGQQAAAEFNAAISGTLERRPQLAQNREAFTTLAGSIKNVGESGRSAGVGMHRLNNSLVVLARRATGAHPVVGQLVDVVGTFAIGTAAMVPILAGIAAVAAGIAAITRESREAKRELGDAVDRLKELGQQRDVAAAGGQTAADVARVEAEIASLHGQIDELRERAARAVAQRVAEPGVFDVQIQALQQRIQELFRTIQPGRAVLREEGLEGTVAELTRRAEAQASAVQRRLDASRVAAETERQLIVITTDFEIQQRREAAERAAEAAESRTDAIEEALEREIEAEARAAKERREQREREQREEERRLRELERARDRAMRNLVRGLNEVGRAFGGTTDQVLSMTAAILSLESVPMRSGRDQAIGLGSAALTGAGFGASTGDPLLGGVSGAIGGNIIAGPAGAIVGGVTGIVSGLIEQGRRARLAAAQWEGFFADFEVMFLDMTPTEQRQHALEQTFRRGAQEAAAAFGGPASVDTIEEARALLETGVAGIPGVSEAYIEALERMVRRYDINSERLLGLTDSIDSLTSALNAPSGFRQSYYRWLAQGVIPVDDPRGLPPTGGGGGGGGGPDRRRGEVVYSGTMENHFHIQSTDPERAAEEIVRVWERQAIRGGPGPMEMTTR